MKAAARDHLRKAAIRNAQTSAALTAPSSLKSHTLQQGLVYASPDQERDQPVSGRTLVITGTLPTRSRSEATALIEAHGGRVTGSVSSKTDYLLCGEKAGSKRAEAEQLGVPIIDEQGLREMVGEI